MCGVSDSAGVSNNERVVSCQISDNHQKYYRPRSITTTPLTSTKTRDAEGLSAVLQRDGQKEKGQTKTRDKQIFPSTMFLPYFLHTHTQTAKDGEGKRSPSEYPLSSVKEINHRNKNNNNLDAQIDPNRPSNCGVTRAQ